jgi:glycosyltransferase involved in cell wall biosynthesis
MANVAFLFSGVNGLAGGGGAERFFSGFFEDYNVSGPKHKLFFISDKSSVENFNQIGSLRNRERILTYKLMHNRFKDSLEFAQMVKLIVQHNIKLIQVPLYGVQYYSLLKRLDKLPSAIRPKIVITIVDSFVPHHYLLKNDRYNFAGVFGGLFNTINIDSVVCWNELFKEFAEKNNIIKSKPQIFPITSRYSVKEFDRSVKKKNHILYAGRFTTAKRPLMFVEALKMLKQRNPAIMDWKCFMYGKGYQEQEIIEKINTYGLNDLITVSHNADLTRVFEESKCFVSTQDYENFPSLSMNEAMAAGNAIIARNVGQTSLFVKHKVNGLLCEPDNEEGLANAIEEYIQRPEQHENMAKESIRLTEEVHTFKNFKTQIELFWDKTLNPN